jgi:hypothetical protein
MKCLTIYLTVMLMSTGAQAFSLFGKKPEASKKSKLAGGGKEVAECSESAAKEEAGLFGIGGSKEPSKKSKLGEAEEKCGEEKCGEKCSSSCKSELFGSGKEKKKSGLFGSGKGKKKSGLFGSGKGKKKSGLFGSGKEKKSKLAECPLAGSTSREEKEELVSNPATSG